MINRIGDRQAKYFDVIDLTSGYHQASIDESCRASTAFITFMGVYQWTRVPMGLKSSGSFFQAMMASVVLCGMIYILCEVYMDDVLIYGKSEGEFVENLTKVFKRFREHNITINPKKCKLGLTEVTFVGHKIDRMGVTFEQERIQRILDLKPPTTQKGRRHLSKR